MLKMSEHGTIRFWHESIVISHDVFRNVSAVDKLNHFRVQAQQLARAWIAGLPASNSIGSISPGVSYSPSIALLSEVSEIDDSVLTMQLFDNGVLRTGDVSLVKSGVFVSCLLTSYIMALAHLECITSIAKTNSGSTVLWQKQQAESRVSQLEGVPAFAAIAPDVIFIMDESGYGHFSSEQPAITLGASLANAVRPGDAYFTLIDSWVSSYLRTVQYEGEPLNSEIVDTLLSAVGVTRLQEVGSSWTRLTKYPVRFLKIDKDVVNAVRADDGWLFPLFEIVSGAETSTRSELFKEYVRMQSVVSRRTKTDKGQGVSVGYGLAKALGSSDAFASMISDVLPLIDRFVESIALASEHSNRTVAIAALVKSELRHDFSGKSVGRSFVVRDDVMFAIGHEDVLFSYDWPFDEVPIEMWAYDESFRNLLSSVLELQAHMTALWLSLRVGKKPAFNQGTLTVEFARWGTRLDEYSIPGMLDASLIPAQWRG